MLPYTREEKRKRKYINILFFKLQYHMHHMHLLLSSIYAHRFGSVIFFLYNFSFDRRPLLTFLLFAFSFALLLISFTCRRFDSVMAGPERQF